MAEWVVDQLSGNRLRRGASPAYHVVRGGLDTLVRETLQNSKDQAIQSGRNPVLVRYSLIELGGGDKAAFLKAMDWSNLRRHLEATIEDPGDIAAKLRAGMGELDDNESLLCLRIEDFRARGLEGGDFDRDKNFSLLCRAEFKTSSIGGRGGSYGLGKAVLWKFSGISTVLMSSLVLGEKKRGIRLFGRTDIPSHELPDGREFDSGGWFGAKRKSRTGPYAESIYGDTKLASALCLDRNGSTETGTSVLIVGFTEPEEDRTRDLEEIAEGILASAERWFWPSMTGPRPSMDVEVVVESGGKPSFRKKAAPSGKWEPFIRAWSGRVANGKAGTSRSVALSEIPFEVPQRLQPKGQFHEEIRSSLALRITRDKGKWEEHEQANKVAIIRGAGMVVKYYEARRKPLDEIPFFGVLLAGKAAGKSRDHERMEEFFRAAEPPLHDDWDYTETVKHSYKLGAKARLTGLWRTLEEKIFSLIEDDVTPKEAGPELLSRLFPLGRSLAVEKRQKVKSRITASRYLGGRWQIEGEIVCARFDAMPWDVRIGFIAQADSGAGEYMLVKSLKTTLAAARVENLGPPAEVKVAGTTDRFGFTVELEPPPSLEKADLDLTAIRFSH